jgi:predicted Zn finger-like uncharacterized protein
MTFECTNCQLRYKIDDSLIPPDGARVKCRRCSTLIDVPAPVIELAPVDLELIPPPPPRRAPRVEEAPAEGIAEPSPERIAEPSPAPQVADPGLEVVGEGVTLEQQLAAEARSVPPSPDIEHDSSFVERFDTPSPATIPADPAFEHIGAAAAQATYTPAAPALETEPLGTPPPQPAFDSTPALETAPALQTEPGLETSALPSLGEPPIAEPSLGAPAFTPPSPVAPSMGAPSLDPALEPSSAPPSLGAPTLESNPPEPEAPAAAPALAAPALATSDTASGEARMATDNVVPLTLGTPIPDGLSPEEKTRHEKARRLARVLASDIAIYNREKKERGMVDGNLVAVLGYEIKKSWETYKERVGADFANSTPYFRDALNDLLAEGKKIF